MTEGRIHRASAPDGTQIAGPVHGQGPPLVLAHGGVDDGTLSWETLLPLLSDRFTCFVPAMRGRGHSADHPDHRPERHAEDLAAFVNSIGEDVGLVGYSTGGTTACGAVARGTAVAAIGLFESAVFEYWEEGEDGKRFQAGIVAMHDAVDEGRLADGARAILRAFSNDTEMAAMERAGAFGRFGRFVPDLLRVIEQAQDTAAPSPNDPAELAKITLPCLLLHGSRTTTAHADSMRYLAKQLPDARLRELEDVGHMAPILAPEPVAAELTGFFEQTLI